jgi:hypothetical protein
MSTVHRHSFRLSSVLEHGRTALTWVRALMMDKELQESRRSVRSAARPHPRNGLKPFEHQNEGTSILEWNE